MSEALTTTAFDYAQLAHNEPVVRGIATRINSTMRTLATSVFAIGRELSLARKLTGDRFYEWADSEFGFKERSIRNYCRVYEQLGDYEDRMSTIPPSTLYLLAGECVPPEAIETVIARTEAGEKVTADDAKEIIADSLDYVETEPESSEDDDENDEDRGPEFDEWMDGPPEPVAASNAGKPTIAPIFSEISRDIERLELKIDGACQPSPRVERIRGLLNKINAEWSKIVSEETEVV